MTRNSLSRWTLLVLALTLAAAASAAETATSKFGDLRFRSIGPATGGRVSRAVGVPDDPLTYYAATSQGGVWKSTDGGHQWQPIFDHQPVASIGSIAVAPSDPNVVYVGSGEANMRGNVIAGQGIFRSTDGGKSWAHVWKQVGQIGTMAVDPHNSDVAFAAVLGHAFGPNPERGVYRTLDGGDTWERVLSKDPDTGASDVAIDPNNPRIVFAGLWQARRYPWDLQSGGPGSGLYRSADGGTTWTQLAGGGLPDGIWGKVGVAVAPSDGDRVYALIEAENGGLFRSDDGGTTWMRINGDHALVQRAWYYSTLTVDPANPDVVWAPQVPLLRSIDGGKTIQSVNGTDHGDNHDLWIDPYDTRRMILSNDGGVEITLDGGASWWKPNLPIAQFYNIDADGRDPMHVGGSMQDLGTASGPIDSLRRGGITLGDWVEAGGGEAGDFVYDLADPDIIYAGEYGGFISVHDLRTGNSRAVSIYPTNASGHGAEDLRYRFQWTAPIAVSPHDPRELFHGANVLFRSRDRGQTWQAISPDLTRNDKSKQKWAGGPITGDNTGVEVYDTIFSLAVSPHEKGVIWAGSDDGLVHLTRDDGASWQNVTPRGMPEWGTVESIEVSPYAPATAWVVVDGHRLDDQRPHLFRTSDYGKSWEDLSAGLPQDAPLFVVRADPKRAGLLYGGNERGVLYSLDNGRTWDELDGGLPTVKVTDLVVRRDCLVVGTTGRSLWVLDDLTPLRVWSAELEKEPLTLFTPLAARRWALAFSWSGEAAEENPPYGAAIYYRLGAKVDDEIRLEIRDARGRLVRTLTSVAETPEFAPDDSDEPTEEPKPALSAEAGLHRAVWDLRWQGLEHLEKAKIDTGSYARGPRAVPGRYELTLIVGGESRTTSLEVLPDPRLAVSTDDLTLQLEASLAALDEVRGVLNEIRQVRQIRTQAAELATRLGDDPARGGLAEVTQRVVRKCDSLEERLHNPKAEIVYDILAQRGGTQLLSNLVFVYVTTGWGDGAPTQGTREVFAGLQGEHAALSAELAELRRGDVAEIDRLASELGLPRILVAGS